MANGLIILRIDVDGTGGGGEEELHGSTYIKKMHRFSLSNPVATGWLMTSNHRPVGLKENMKLRYNQETLS